jgi:plastocyanin
MPRRIFSIILILSLLVGGLLLFKPQQTTQAQAAGNVSVVSFSFQPASLTINVGQTVTWTNNSTMAHTVTSDTGVWDSGTLNAGGTFSFTFTTPGTYTYHCAFHSSMTGTIVVVGPTTPTAIAPTRTFTRTSTSTIPVVTLTGSRTPTVTQASTNDTPLPDLTVSSVTYLGSNPACANSPKVQVIVANIGPFPATGSFLVSLNGSLAQTVNGLAAGQSATLIFSATSATATVDSTNVITETNESNNSLSGNFGLPTQAHTCTPSGPTFTATRTPTARTSTPTITPTSLTGAFPDLVISSVVSSPPGWTGGCAVILTSGIRVTVRNNGTVNAGTFIVDVSGDQQTVTGLAAGASINLWFSRTGSLVITADITNMVAESSESNNTFSYVTITGTPPVLCTRTPTPTGSVTTVITNTPTLTLTPTRTITKTPTVCPLVSGFVRLGSSTGPGMVGVKITAVVLGTTITTTTDANGHYSLTGCGIQGTVITPQLATYSFSPTQQTYVMFAASVDFVGNISTPTPVTTRTPTSTPGTPTPTPTSPSNICSPVTSTVTAPFTFDGAGTFCWQASSLGSFINSWNTTSVSLNGVNVSNVYVASGSYPAKVNGFYYISYNSAVAWGHFEAK